MIYPVGSSIQHLNNRSQKERYSHTLPIRVCAAQRGRDLEAPDLQRGIIFRTHESSSFVSSHLKLFKDGFLKIRFNALTSKLLDSCCTLERSIKTGPSLERGISSGANSRCIWSRDCSVRPRLTYFSLIIDGHSTNGAGGKIGPQTNRHDGRNPPVRGKIMQNVYFKNSSDYKKHGYLIFLSGSGCSNVE